VVVFIVAVPAHNSRLQVCDKRCPEELEERGTELTIRGSPSEATLTSWAHPFPNGETHYQSSDTLMACHVPSMLDSIFPAQYKSSGREACSDQSSSRGSIPSAAGGLTFTNAAIQGFFNSRMVVSNSKGKATRPGIRFVFRHRLVIVPHIHAATCGRGRGLHSSEVQLHGACWKYRIVLDLNGRQENLQRM
jgi:hypothetical protein